MAVKSELGHPLKSEPHERDIDAFNKHPNQQKFIKILQMLEDQFPKVPLRISLSKLYYHITNTKPKKNPPLQVYSNQSWSLTSASSHLQIIGESFCRFGFGYDTFVKTLQVPYTDITRSIYKDLLSSLLKDILAKIETILKNSQYQNQLKDIKNIKVRCRLKILRFSAELSASAQSVLFDVVKAVCQSTEITRKVNEIFNLYAEIIQLGGDNAAVCLDQQEFRDQTKLETQKLIPLLNNSKQFTWTAQLDAQLCSSYSKSKNLNRVLLSIARKFPQYRQNITTKSLKGALCRLLEKSIEMLKKEGYQLVETTKTDIEGLANSLRAAGLHVQLLELQKEEGKIKIASGKRVVQSFNSFFQPVAKRPKLAESHRTVNKQQTKFDIESMWEEKHKADEFIWNDMDEDNQEHGLELPHHLGTDIGNPWEKSSEEQSNEQLSSKQLVKAEKKNQQKTKYLPSFDDSAEQNLFM